MNMKLRIFSAALTAIAGAGLLPAADSQLLGLVMPDVKILADINVDQAKASGFGQFVIGKIQAQSQDLQQVIAQTGFDPTVDLDEVLLASVGPPSQSALTLARGNFNPAKINAAAQKAGAASEVYNGITIVEDPKHTHGFAFLGSVIAIAGDIASVKGAISRQTTPTSVPAALLSQVNQDAWVVSEVPPPALQPPANHANLPQIPASVLQSIQQSSAGVKFGPQIAIKAELQSDTPQNAMALAGVLQFLVNLAQMQAQQNAQALSALQSVAITTSQNMITISDTISEATAEALFPSKSEIRNQAPAPRRGRRP